MQHPIYFEPTGVAVITVCVGPTKTFVRRNLTAFLEYGQEYVDKLKDAPCQQTLECGVNIVKAIEQAENGQVWLADMGKLELIKPHQYWHMSDELVDYMNKN